MKALLAAAAVLAAVAPATSDAGGADARLTFVRAGSIYVASPDLRSAKVYLAAKTRGFSTYAYSSPAWSPAGSSLVADRSWEFAADSLPDQEMVVFRRRHSPLSLTCPEGSGCPSEGHASWAPDGRRIVYVGFFWFQQPYDAGRLVIANVASGRHGWLTRQGRHDHMPAWSPDGKLIAFVRQQVPYLKGLRPGPRHLHVISPTGGTAKQLTTYEAINPSWSPDGRYIAFDDGKRIGIVRRQGGPARFIATGTDPAWSPDGAKIAFVRNKSIWLVGATGQRPRLAIRNAVDPAWRVGAAHIRVRDDAGPSQHRRTP